MAEETAKQLADWKRATEDYRNRLQAMIELLDGTASLPDWAAFEKLQSMTKQVQGATKLFQGDVQRVQPKGSHVVPWEPPKA